MRYLNQNISKQADDIVAQYVPTRDVPSGPVMLKRIEPGSGSTGAFPMYFYCKQTAATWHDPRDVATMRATTMAHELFARWKNAFSSLWRLASHEKIGATVEYRVLFWLVQAYITKSDLPCPELISTGTDMGVDIEWSGDSFFLSLQIENSRDSQGLLYFEFEDHFQSKELSIKALRDVLSTI